MGEGEVLVNTPLSTCPQQVFMDGKLLDSDALMIAGPGLGKVMVVAVIIVTMIVLGTLLLILLHIITSSTLTVIIKRLAYFY